MAGEWVQVEGSQYQDLGQVLTAGAIAAGAVVYSPAYGTGTTGLSWVRNVVALVQIDAAGWSVILQRGDSQPVTDWGTSIGSSGTTTGTSSWGSITAIGTNGLIGYQAKFGLKNTSASASTVGNLHIQLFGL